MRPGDLLRGDGDARSSALTTASRQAFRGCLLGGAIGDALGAPVEFMSRARIRERYGEQGIDRFDVAYDRVGAITDDTQMTMFTAEGLLLGCRVAAITHGHPSGYLAAGALAVIIRLILDGGTVAHGAVRARSRLSHEPDNEECDTALRKVMRRWWAEGPNCDIEEFGQGWVAEEALAMGVYAAMVGETDLQRGLTVAVNHSGDSDSTGAIAGNILGAIHGEEALSRLSFGEVELRDEVIRLADGLFDAWMEQPGWSDRYSDSGPPT